MKDKVNAIVVDKAPKEKLDSVFVLEEKDGNVKEKIKTVAEEKNLEE